jgi:hypothetical protein
MKKPDITFDGLIDAAFCQVEPNGRRRKALRARFAGDVPLWRRFYSGLPAHEALANMRAILKRERKP